MMHPIQMPARLAAAQAIVDEAAVLAQAAFRQRADIAMRAKQPQDFVSVIDEQVERLMRACLATAFPHESVIGEEYGGDFSAQTWVIDPIDGTTNFLRGIPLWSISLGFIQDGQPTVGLVAMPALGLSVSAELGSGLFCNGQRTVREAIFPQVSVMSAGDGGDDIEQHAQINMALRRAGWTVESYRSTALAMAFSALGYLDGHLQKQVKLWDMAAGLALCAEAGLVVRHHALRHPENSVVVATPALMQAIDAAGLW